MPEGSIACWVAGPADISCHFAIRQRVFVEEQGVMVFTDVDAFDREDSTHHVVAARGTKMAGTVRLYPITESNGRWKGDRLAVLPSHRTTLVGMRLVRFAVATAAAAGGLEMEARVQTANTVFFERLGWLRDGDVSPYYGIPHQPMKIDLTDVAQVHHEQPDFTELLLPFDRFEHSPLLVSS